MALDEKTGTASEIDDDLNTTAPQSKPAPWSMPEPVYRKTSGKLPQGYAKSVESGIFSDEVNSVSGEINSASGDGAKPERTPPSVAVPPATPRPSNPTLKIVVVILGILAMIGFLIAFLTVIYFFFLRSSE